jgi:phenylalanyl-tRNA synthetase beta chain
LQIEAKAPTYYHPGRAGALKQGERILALFGEIHPAVVEAADGQGPMVGFEIFLDALPALKVKTKAAIQLSVYQAVERDFAFVVDQQVAADQLIRAITKADRSAIVQVFDQYQGDKLPKGKKSLALNVRIEPKEKTLTEPEIAEWSKQIVDAITKATGGVLRQS